AAEPVYDVQPI
nr:high-molecular weight protein 1, HMW1=cytadherence-acessory protein [Mycoplasma pneumoniae, Peptide Partial, 11 aa] [Mycoplasmoides pneumoniae]